MLVALFDSELLCSPPSNRATKRLACVGFVWQADMGDEYDIIIIITTTTSTSTTTTTPTPTTPTTTPTTTTTSTLCASAFRAGSARVVLRGFRARGRIQIS